MREVLDDLFRVFRLTSSWLASARDRETVDRKTDASLSSTRQLYHTRSVNHCRFLHIFRPTALTSWLTTFSSLKLQKLGKWSQLSSVFHCNIFSPFSRFAAVVSGMLFTALPQSYTGLGKRLKKCSQGPRIQNLWHDGLDLKHIRGFTDSAHLHRPKMC